MTRLLDTEKHKREQKVLADIHDCYDNMDRLLFSGKGYSIAQYGAWQNYGQDSQCTTTIGDSNGFFYAVTERRTFVAPHVPAIISFTVRQVYPVQKTITVYE